MAKKFLKEKDSLMSEHKRMILPSTIGGVVAWLFSGVFMIGFVVFLAIWVGNWMGKMFFKR